jgi:predicted DNA-binding transcriptional regulator AlpA
MISRHLRYRDLEERGIVPNRGTLRNWIRDQGFPPGSLVGPNTRLWQEAEITAWLASRPTELKAAPKLKPSSRRGRPKAEAQAEA